MLSVWVKTQTWVAKAMKAYRAVGTFRNGRANQKYSLDVVATDEEEAKHLVYSNFGSRHGTFKYDTYMQVLVPILYLTYIIKF